MPLLLAASLYPPQTRGPATFAGQLVEYLQARKERVEVVLYREVAALPPGVRHLVYFWKLFMRAKGVKAILALDPVSVGLPALWVSIVRGIPLVVRLGGDYAWEQGVARFGVAEGLDEFVRGDVERFPFMVSTLIKIERMVARRAHTVVVPSTYLQTIIEHWGVDPKKIVVIGSAAEVSRASLPKEEIRKRVGWGQEPIIFSAGALVPWKGFGGLIEAVAFVRKEHPDVRLIIAGEGPLRKELERKAGARGFDPQQVFTGPLPHTILLELLRAADVFALNTSYEGLSHQLIEAMQVGVPIVTTPVGGNIDLISDKVSGLLVKHDEVSAFASAIKQLLAHSSTAAGYARAARARASALSPEVSCQKWLKLLKSV